MSNPVRWYFTDNSFILCWSSLNHPHWPCKYWKMFSIRGYPSPVKQCFLSLLNKMYFYLNLIHLQHCGESYTSLRPWKWMNERVVYIGLKIKALFIYVPPQAVRVLNPLDLMNGAGQSDCSVLMSVSNNSSFFRDQWHWNPNKCIPQPLRNHLNMCPEVLTILPAQVSPLMVTQASMVFRSREDPKTITYPNGTHPIRSSAKGIVLH